MIREVTIRRNKSISTLEELLALAVLLDHSFVVFYCSVQQKSSRHTMMENKKAHVSTSLAKQSNSHFILIVCLPQCLHNDDSTRFTSSQEDDPFAGPK